MCDIEQMPPPAVTDETVAQFTPPLLRPSPSRLSPSRWSRCWRSRR
ncbi:MAG: hypothetical protein ACRDN0_34895 [Trebonia sp.]